MIKKKIIALCVISVVAVLFVACGKGENATEEIKTEVITANASDQESMIVEEQKEVTTEAVAEEEFNPIGEWSCHNSNGEKSIVRFDEDGTGDSISGSVTDIDFVTWEYDAENSIMNVTYVDYNMAYAFLVRKQDNYYIIAYDEDPNFFFVKDENYDAACGYEVDSNEICSNGVEVKQGDVIEKEFATITLDEIGVQEDIQITSTASGASVTCGPKPEEGKSFLYVKGTIKNLNKEALPADEICGEIDINGYKYEISVIACNSSAVPTFDVEPLDTVIFKLYCNIPNELINEMETATISFAFNDQFSSVCFSEMEQCTYQYIINYK